MSSNKGSELSIPEEAAKSALCACYFGLLWDLNYIQGTIERESTTNAVNNLKQKVDMYMDSMQEVFYLKKKKIIYLHVLQTKIKIIIFIYLFDRC